MRAYIDSYLLIRVIFPDKKNVTERRQYKTIIKSFEVEHNIISLVESARNYKLSDFKRRKLHQLIGSGPTVPDNEDWKVSHYMLMQWAKDNKIRDKKKLRKMQMDCLIAAMAINRRYYVVTHDNDFTNLKDTDLGRSLKLFYP